MLIAVTFFLKFLIAVPGTKTRPSALIILKLIYILTSLQIHNKIVHIFTEYIHYHVYSS